VLVPLLLLLTVGLRWVGLGWELPNRYHYFSYHPDEVFLLIPSYQYFAQGDWNPHFFNYGTLYIYLVGIPAVLTGAAMKFPFTGLYWLGRLITALLGMGTVVLLYFAVGVMAGNDQRRCRSVVCAINSHYATVMPATFWLVLIPLRLRGGEAGLAAGKPPTRRRIGGVQSNVNMF
jgi:hypothetical protein